VRARVEGLRYGSVQIVVHEAKVVQIECTERLRPDPAGPGRAEARRVGARAGRLVAEPEPQCGELALLLLASRLFGRRGGATVETVGAATGVPSPQLKQGANERGQAAVPGFPSH